MSKNLSEPAAIVFLFDLDGQRHDGFPPPGRQGRGFSSGTVGAVGGRCGRRGGFTHNVPGFTAPTSADTSALRRSARTSFPSRAIALSASRIRACRPWSPCRTCIPSPRGNRMRPRQYRFNHRLLDGDIFRDGAHAVHDLSVRLDDFFDHLLRTGTASVTFRAICSATMVRRSITITPSFNTAG